MIKQTSNGPLTVGSRVEREAPLQDGPPTSGVVVEVLDHEVIIGWDDGEATPVLTDNVKRKLRDDWRAL